jgi:hypothetical protein
MVAIEPEVAVGTTRDAQRAREGPVYEQCRLGATQWVGPRGAWHSARDNGSSVRAVGRAGQESEPPDDSEDFPGDAGDSDDFSGDAGFSSGPR